jgi:hypothetical protein
MEGSLYLDFPIAGETACVGGALMRVVSEKPMSFEKALIGCRNEVRVVVCIKRTGTLAATTSTARHTDSVEC